MFPNKMFPVALHISFVKPVAASTLRVAIHFIVPRSHVLSVDIMPTICLIDRQNPAA
jgi:hypothetical protein